MWWAAHPVSGDVLPVREPDPALTRWFCECCDVGMAARFKPVCWFCLSGDHVVRSTEFRSPCSPYYQSLVLQHVEAMT